MRNILSQTTRRRRIRGFTLIEVMISAAILSGALLVLFGFHARAVSVNGHAKKMTDCTYLAQAEMERLISIPWSAAYEDPYLVDTNGDDTTTDSDPWVFLEQPEGGSEPDARTAQDNPFNGPRIYLVTWDVKVMDPGDDTWMRIRVRCQYKDTEFNVYKGTTISSYKFRDR